MLIALGAVVVLLVVAAAWFARRGRRARPGDYTVDTVARAMLDFDRPAPTSTPPVPPVPPVLPVLPVPPVNPPVEAAAEPAVDWADPDPAHPVAAGLAARAAGRDDVAERLWAGADDPAAAFHLGVLRQDRGELDAAAAAYQRCIDSGDAEHAPKAAYNLGGLRLEQGERDAAADAWQQAVESGHPEHAPDAAMELGNLHAERGDYAAARAAYRTAATGAAGPQALVNIGIVHQVEGDLSAAAEAYRRALDTDRPEVVHRAQALLADLPASALRNP